VRREKLRDQPLAVRARANACHRVYIAVMLATLNAFVFSAFGGIALLIAVVGVAGVLAFSVSARTREFGIRMAIGSTPLQLLTRVLKEGVVIVTAGITASAVFGYLLVHWRQLTWGPPTCQECCLPSARPPSSRGRR